MRLTLQPRTIKTLLAGFPSIDASVECVSAIIAAGIVPRVLEALDKTTVDSVEAYSHAGYPSTEAVLLIEVPDEQIVKRISGRRVCSKNGNHIYHVEANRPKHEGVCDVDGAKLIQRDDDKPETVQNRLNIYHEQTSQLIPFYEDRGLLRRFDGTRSPTEVHDHIRATIATLRLEDEL